jgi:hypothetical protein
MRGPSTQNSTLAAEVAELADARDSKSREVTPRVGSTPTFGTNDRMVLRDRISPATVFPRWSKV